MERIKKFIFAQPLWRKLLALAVIAAIGYATVGRTKHAGIGPTFTARRGKLEINVLQGGSIEALESQAVKCEVKGYQGVKILKIVEEGYQVTEDDVKTNKVLVELDSSEIQKQITLQEIEYGSALAALTDAAEGYEIQVNQNVSDINAALEKAKFARMDFDKAMGSETSAKVIAQLGLSEDVEAPKVTPKPAAVPPIAESEGSGAAAPEEDKPTPITLKKVPENAPAPEVVDEAQEPVKRAELMLSQTAVTLSQMHGTPIAIDFSKYANLESLGDGEAKQKMRKNEDDLQVAQKEFSQAETQLAGTQRLFEKGFVTQTEVEADKFKYENSRLKVQTAETARDLYLKYEFPKTNEETLSKYIEAARELARTRKGAISKLAQSAAKLRSAEGHFKLAERQRNDLHDQLTKCTIRAQNQGLVVYGAGNMNMFYGGGEEQIREGSLVREQQPIITIPDMAKMALKVRIHETYIKKISKGLKVRITVEAFPDKVLTGEISKVGVLPDSQNMWMNPDMKVYLTTITIGETQSWLKPGMTAKAEILVKAIPDTVYVPIQAVTMEGEKQVCLLAQGGRQVRREIEAGDFNDEFIEVKNGIKEGDVVCLRNTQSAEEKGKKSLEGADKTKAAEASKDDKKSK